MIELGGHQGQTERLRGALIDAEQPDEKGNRHQGAADAEQPHADPAGNPDQRDEPAIETRPLRSGHFRGFGDHLRRDEQQEQGEQRAQQPLIETAGQMRARPRGDGAGGGDPERLAPRDRIVAGIAPGADQQIGHHQDQGGALGGGLVLPEGEDQHRNRDEAAADAEQPAGETENRTESQQTDQMKRLVEKAHQAR
jgi:hypothetical protein